MFAKKTSELLETTAKFLLWIFSPKGKNISDIFREKGENTVFLPHSILFLQVANCYTMTVSRCSYYWLS